MCFQTLISILSTYIHTRVLLNWIQLFVCFPNALHNLCTYALTHESLFTNELSIWPPPSPTPSMSLLVVLMLKITFFKLWIGCWHNLDHFLAFHVEIGHIFLVTLEWSVSQDSTWDVLWMWGEDVSWWAPFCNWYFLLITTCNMGFTFVCYPIIPNTCHILYKSCLESCILILDSIPSKKAIAPNCIFYVLKVLSPL